MKIFNFFSQVVTIFAFLTLGSLLLIIACGILSLDDAVWQVQELYAGPWRSMQIAAVGAIFITIGLYTTRLLLKHRRQDEALIYQSEIGPIVVSVTAMEDVIKKVLKRFHLVKEWKTKILIQGKEVDIKLRLVLWSGGRIQELLIEIQNEIRTRIRKLLGADNPLAVTCDVQRIEDHESGMEEQNPSHDKASSF